MKNKRETATGYLSINSNAFEKRIAEVLSPFEDYEHRALYEVVETYKPLEIVNEELYLKQSYNTYMRKRELTLKEKEMIDDYLATHDMIKCEPDATSSEYIDTYESLILEPLDMKKA